MRAIVSLESALAVPLGIKGIQIAKTFPATAIHKESAMPAVKKPAKATSTPMYAFEAFLEGISEGKHALTLSAQELARWS